MIPTSIDGTDITGATIDGTDVTEITVDGDTVFTAGPPKGKFVVTVDRLTNNRFTIFELQTPFELQNVQSTTDFTTSNSRGFSAFISPDGTKVYCGYNDPDEVLQFDLSTPFDASTASQTGQLSFTDGVTGIDIQDNGTRLYLSNASSGNITEFSLSTPFDINSATAQYTVTESTNGLSLADSGQKLFVKENGINEFDLSTPYDLRTRNLVNTQSVTQSDIRGLYVKEDGTRFYSTDRGSDEIRQYDASTPYDVTSLTFSKSIPTPTSDNLGVGLN